MRAIQSCSRPLRVATRREDPLRFAVHPSSENPTALGSANEGSGTVG
jgi:hypothetical protein